MLSAFPSLTVPVEATSMGDTEGGNTCDPQRELPACTAHWQLKSRASPSPGHESQLSMEGSELCSTVSLQLLISYPSPFSCISLEWYAQSESHRVNLSLER